jgi:endonuclease/exonuclease/phosphatase family metal-dependent hydrolase
MDTFRVATLNIWNRYGPWEARLPAIRHALAALAPEVMGMQEVVRSADFDQAKVISDGLGYHIAWGQASGEVGDAILSRWPILRSETIPLPQVHSHESRSVVFAEIDAPFGRLPFFCTHLNWMLHHGHIRQRQVRALADAVARLAPEQGFPPVIVGDFNAEPNSDEIRFMGGLTNLGGECVYFADCFAHAGDGSPGATFSRSNPFAEPVREPDRRIDYIFVRGPDAAKRGETIDARVCFNHPHEGTFPTDHFGVTATLTAGPGPAANP